ncbi:protein of unknown function [Acidithiobacillus ferrivorans]|uniref:Uncharacterized protein n=1 Tax=Acidithiobacillus ferrivorans TaxID=160808 RepID=A0A060UUB8_9PROT|nr:hypothetical protein AFERRI_40116 [Acidithiobacillus ferrivorans]SMH64121.1 protein of unknown function [Acidithiobacillus ferrivorans]
MDTGKHIDTINHIILIGRSFCFFEKLTELFHSSLNHPRSGAYGPSILMLDNIARHLMAGLQLKEQLLFCPGIYIVIIGLESLINDRNSAVARLLTIEILL